MSLFDYQLLLSYHTCHQLFSDLFLSMEVFLNFHDFIIHSVVHCARNIQDLISHMAMGKILPLLARIRLVTTYVQNEQVLIDLVSGESMMKDNRGGEGMCWENPG